MLGQLNIYGNDKVQTAIKRLQTFEPPEGYYLAFSGGKDSVVVKALADMASVKYDAHYALTSVDPPELVHFIKSFNDVHIDVPRYKDGKAITMWNLIPRACMPPTRIVRYCCERLKEHGGEGRFKLTGIRKAESARRKNTRAGLELSDKRSTRRERMDPDNPSQELIHICQTKSQRILNPIIDWTNEDVWEFIKKYEVRYCKLYDLGYKRLGCIGCPMGSKKREELEKYPKYKEAYKRAFQRMINARLEKGLETKWETAEDVMNWWLKT